MTRYDAGQFDIAVIGAGRLGTRRKPGRALRAQAFSHSSENLGGGGIHFRRALRPSRGTRVALTVRWGERYDPI